jgi:AcrR family transcriptional regulator
MPRGAGTHNRDYAEKRAALLARAVAALLETPGERPSLREIAARLGVSVPTLRHYFGDRDGLLAEAMGAISDAGEPYLEVFATPSGPLRESLTAALGHLVQGFRRGRLDRAHVLGLAEGLHHAKLGTAYLERLLEPTFAALRRRLSAHRARGEIVGGEDGMLALSLVAPLILLLLRRGALSGGALDAGETERLVEETVDGFVRAWGSTPPAPPGSGG